MAPAGRAGPRSGEHAPVTLPPGGRAVLAAAAGALLLAAPDAGRAAELPSGDTVPDPEQVLDEAKDRQRGFERHRRRRLPYGGGRSAGRCDEVVGRYCLWHEDGEDRDAEPPEEPQSVRRERDRLLEHLRSAVQGHPTSGWLIGQRVRYLLEAGRDAEALEAARRCGAEPWWCAALEGRVLHAGGRFVAAGEAFRRAERSMEEGTRRGWRDLSVVLEGDASGRWDDLGRRGRRATARRLWRLADPLHVVSGNDRRTEHLSRRVEVRIRRDAATPFGRFWTDGLGELTLRYGLPFEYRREPPSPSRLDPEPIVVGRHPPDALSFLPPADGLLRPGEIDQEAWRLDDPRPHTSYSPPYADTVRRLEHRLSVFPRGDTSVVVAVYRAEPPEDTAAADGEEREGDGTADADERPAREALLRLVPTAALDSPTVEDRAREDRRTGALRGGLAVTVPTRPHVLSLELLQRDVRIADRARYAVRPTRRPEGVPGLSDVLLLEPGVRPEGPLGELVRHARAPSPVRPGARLGVYWELYGPRLLLEDVEVSVALAREDGDLVERIAGALGLGQEEGVALEWRDAAARPGRVHPRGVRVRLPDDLPEGDYRLRVSVDVPGYDPMTAVRPIEVAERE